MPYGSAAQGRVGVVVLAVPVLGVPAQALLAWR
jgi:hypothetical protein